MRLASKRALVTGGASGIGRAIVELFIREGAAVAICDRNEQGCRALANQFAQRHRVAAIVGDVSKPEDAQRMIEESVAALGGLEVLVNSAGVAAAGNAVDLAVEDWNRVIGVNLTGVYLMSKYAIPEIAKAGGGSILNIASIAAFIIAPGQTAYTASKGAVAALTRAMAVDFAAANIRVNCICPGHIETPLVVDHLKATTGNNWKEVLGGLGELYPMKRIGQPCEVASVALFLAGNEASFMTGSAVVADGGYTLL